jgi:hypothetical protein
VDGLTVEAVSYFLNGEIVKNPFLLFPLFFLHFQGELEGISSSLYSMMLADILVLSAILKLLMMFE